MSYRLVNVNVLLLHGWCPRYISNRPSKDTSSSPRPSGRQQVPGDSLQRHAPCHSEDRKRGGAPGTIFRVSVLDLWTCVCLVVCYLWLPQTLSKATHLFIYVTSLCLQLTPYCTRFLMCYLFLVYFLFWSSHCSTYPYLGPVATHQHKKGGVCVRLACPSVYPSVFVLC